MSFAAPSTSGNFLYNGDLHVDVGNFNRHKRATPTEISALLRPDLKKAKAGPPVKDQVGHWYEAQLIHYGLASSKDKSTAKMRLLDNLNKSNLVVPPDIVAIESDLKKQFAASERKAKAEYKKQAAAAAIDTPQPSTAKKRKISEATDPTAPPKKVKTKTEGAPKTAKVAQTSGKKGVTTVSTPAKSKNTPATSTSAIKSKAKKETASKIDGKEGKAVKPKALPKAIAKMPKPDSSSSAASSKAKVKKEAKPRPQTAIKDEASTGKVQVKEQSTSKKLPQVKKDAASESKKPTKVKKESPSSPQAKVSSLGLINGMYDIECDTLSGRGPLKLNLVLDSPGVWGAFNMGMYKGVLRIHKRPMKAPETCTLQWRGREKGEEGQIVTGSNLQGYISFMGDGKIEGSINLYGDCQFTGSKRGDQGAPPGAIAEMKMEWDRCSEEAYEYERRARWGGGGW